jgi:hypothetical protein
MLGLIVLSSIGLVVIVAVFAALAWAAVQDGRDEAQARALAPRVAPTPARAAPAPARVAPQRRPVAAADFFAGWTVSGRA